ncbi:MAG TPA: HD domain-containing phosphohydrolase [Longimicrobiales bacterium]
MMYDIEHCPILVIDDDEEVVHVLEGILRRAGFEHVHTLTDARRALPLFREVAPDLVVLDHHMPFISGLEVIRQLRARLPAREYFPFLMISGDAERSVRQEALRQGAKDFLAKPFDALEVAARVCNLLETRRLYTRMETMVRRRTARLRKAELEIAERLAAVAELRDYGNAEHTRRVGELSAAVGQALGMSPDEVALLRRAAPLHDLGKAAIPDAVIMSPRRLSLDEMDLVKSHTTLGARMLSGSRSRLLQMAEEIALFHHENWDGTGYTPGLSGEAIPLPGRIVAVADVFDALTHERPYKGAWPPEEALAWILSQRGLKFDPAVVDALVAIVGVEPAKEHRE